MKIKKNYTHTTEIEKISVEQLIENICQYNERGEIEALQHQNEQLRKIVALLFEANPGLLPPLVEMYYPYEFVSL